MKTSKSKLALKVKMFELIDNDLFVIKMLISITQDCWYATKFVLMIIYCHVDLAIDIVDYYYNKNYINLLRH